MVAEKVMALQFWVIKHVSAEEHSCSSGGHNKASQGHHYSTPHVLLLNTLQALEQTPYATVLVEGKDDDMQIVGLHHITWRHKQSWHTSAL